jgi:very-short-patch-repair endonuclease
VADLDKPPLAILRARDLRENATKAERILWHRLRDRQIFGVKFRRQHPVGPFIVDFAATKERLVVELDGEQHALQPGVRHDSERTRELERHGYRVVRFWNLDVLTNLDGVMEAIVTALGKRPLTLPSPPMGER